MSCLDFTLPTFILDPSDTVGRSRGILDAQAARGENKQRANGYKMYFHIHP